jgi:hypothetical protein
MFEAYNKLFDDLCYKGWKEFCGNLLTISWINDKEHQTLADMYAWFVSQERRNVRGQVRSGFDSTTLDNKVCMLFGCAAALQTLNDSKVALESVAQQVMFSLIILKRAKATSAAAPSALAAHKACKQPSAVALRPKISTRGGTACPSSRRPAPQAAGHSSRKSDEGRAHRSVWCGARALPRLCWRTCSLGGCIQCPH